MNLETRNESESSQKVGHSNNSVSQREKRRHKVGDKAKLKTLLLEPIKKKGFPSVCNEVYIFPALPRCRGYVINNYVNPVLAAMLYTSVLVLGTSTVISSCLLAVIERSVLLVLFQRFHFTLSSFYHWVGCSIAAKSDTARSSVQLLQFCSPTDIGETENRLLLNSPSFDIKIQFDKNKKYWHLQLPKFDLQIYIQGRKWRHMFFFH